MALFTMDDLSKFKDSVVEFFSSEKVKKPKTNNYHSYTNKSTRQRAKTYTSRGKQNFNHELKIFKNKERQRLMDKYKVCNTLFYPAKFRASYTFSQDNQNIQQIDLELPYIEAELKEIQIMEKHYVKQKNS